MVSRSNDGEESILTSSRAPGSPVKSRLMRSGTSPTKREDRSSKALSKDDSELKDYVRCPDLNTPDFPPLEPGDELGIIILTAYSNWEIV